MSIENPFDNKNVPQGENGETKNSKELFLAALEKELIDMEQTGRLSPEQVEEKRKAASLIETGFSDDPTKDALIFSRSGVAGEKEMIDIFNKK